MKRLLVLLISILALSIPASGAVGQAAPAVIFISTPPETVTAPDANGVTLSYTVDSLNSGGKHPPVTCDHPPDTTVADPPADVQFLAPVGVTTVTCSLEDNSSVSNSFTVTVTPPAGSDTTPPTLAEHADVTIAPGTSPAYVPPTATDDVDPNPTVTCSPGPNDTFAAGTTTPVTCTAKDASGNTSQPESFTVTVSVTPPPPDNQPPAFTTTPPDLTREATGPGGASVTYVVPSATDPEDGPLLPQCTPAPGATFALGTTTVTCTATDSKGASAQVSFHVTVVDTTPPPLTPPDDITVVAASGAGMPASNPTIAAFLGGALATDLVDTSVEITTDAPATFPVGTTLVTFTARDDSGNSTTATAHVKVLAPGSPPPPPPPPVDRTPPADVTHLTAGAGNALVRLSWTPPAKDFDHVVVFRARSDAATATTQVYSGKASSVVDRGLRNGVEYRYTVTAYDAAGNRSTGVVAVATPRAPMLLAPKDGATVKAKRPPMLLWRAYPGARYYNVQLFKVGRALSAAGVVAADAKVLSAWPNKTRLKLGKKWKYKGRGYRLAKGTYRWYVWPGIGARVSAKYGPLMGQQTFVVR